MELYESVLWLIEETSLSPDTVLLIFANAVMVYEIAIAALHGIIIYLVCSLLVWVFKHFKKNNKHD